MKRKDNLGNNPNPKDKLEIAQKIAANSKKVARTYASLENAFIYFFRWVSSLLTKAFFSKRLSKLIALVMAIIMYVSVNLTSSDTFGVTQSATLTGVPVKIIYNSEIYEISGIPESVNVMISGAISDISLQKGKINSVVTADLSGLTEGTHQIKLIPTNFSNDLTVNVLDTPRVNVIIKKKITTKYNISYEYINKNKMDSAFILSGATFDTTEVLIRASQDTINSIAFVKALIDVTDVDADFTREAQIVAYANDGSIVECDIIPEFVTVNVTVTQPTKQVPIIVRPIGKLVEGYAIDEIALDNSIVTISAPVDILALIDAVYIDLDVSAMTKNTDISTTLTMPSGVMKMDITKVNMKITLDKVTSRVITGVKVAWDNVDPKYKPKLVNDADALVNVIVTGTLRNVESIKAEDIFVTIDLSNVVIGVQEVPINVVGDNIFVTYAIEDGRKYVQVEISE
ncbi:MAG: YbbR-like domain-containing protein [Erysipelotrichaceae bacterium]|jgi:YbbR domain-containing protein